MVQPIEGLVVPVPVLVDAQCMERQPLSAQERLVALCPPTQQGEAGAEPSADERSYRVAELSRLLHEVLGFSSGAFDARWRAWPRRPSSASARFYQSVPPRDGTPGSPRSGKTTRASRSMNVDPPPPQTSVVSVTSPSAACALAGPACAAPLASVRPALVAFCVFAVRHVGQDHERRRVLIDTDTAGSAPPDQHVAQRALPRGLVSEDMEVGAA